MESPFIVKNKKTLGAAIRRRDGDGPDSPIFFGSRPGDAIHLHFLFHLTVSLFRQTFLFHLVMITFCTKSFSLFVFWLCLGRYLGDNRKGITDE
jgi:hypothetical protein